MAADSNKCTALYLATAQLAYAISMLSMTPRPPFSVQDQHALSDTSTVLADAARVFRQRDPKEVDDAAVDRAVLSVKTAQVMLDTINLQLTTAFTSTDVMAAIGRAGGDVSAI